MFLIPQDTLPPSRIQDAVHTGIEAIGHHTTSTPGMVITVVAAAAVGHRLGTTTTDPTQSRVTDVLQTLATLLPASRIRYGR